MKQLLFFVLLTTSTLMHGQVGIGTNTPNASSILDVTSTDKGLLPPRLTSDAEVDDPAEGLVIYDESDDCLNVFDGSDWVNLCTQGGSSGGSGTGPGGASSFFPYANTIAFSDIWSIADQPSSAVSVDGNAYMFGGRDSRLLSQAFIPSNDTSSITDTDRFTATRSYDPHYAAYQFDDPVLNGKTKKVQIQRDMVFFLTTDGIMYGFGDNDFEMLHPTVTTAGFYRKNRPIVMPSLNPSEVIEDFTYDYNALIILTTEGRVFFATASTGSYSNIGTEHSEDEWTELAQPTGVVYDKILTTSRFQIDAQRAIYLRGDDGNIYGLGEESDSSDRSFGQTPNPSGYDEPLAQTGLNLINFNSILAAGELIEKVRVANGTCYGISSENQIYVWGHVDANAPVTQVDNTTGSKVNNDYIVPAKLNLPPGETGFRDLVHLVQEDRGIIVVSTSGKMYLYGDVNGFVTTLYTKLNDYTQNYSEVYSWSGIDLIKIRQVGASSMLGLDSNGQVWFTGSDSLSEASFSTPNVKDTSGVAADADDVTHITTRHTRTAVPLFDETFVMFNN